MYMCVGRLSSGVGYKRTEALSIDESEEPTTSSDRSQGSQLDTPLGETQGGLPAENNQRQLNQIKIKVGAKIQKSSVQNTAKVNSLRTFVLCFDKKNFILEQIIH